MFAKVFNLRRLMWSKTYNFGLHFIDSGVNKTPYYYK